MKNKIQLALVLAIPLLYLFAAVFTLSDYGINWDEPYHFQRGQAFLHYFLTGNQNYDDLPAYPYLSKNCQDNKAECDSPGGPADVVKASNPLEIYEDAINQKQVNFGQKRSYFQSDYFNFDFFMTKDLPVTPGGHPPANDVLSAFTNFIFFQKLKIMGDIESHHLFEVLAVFSIILAVAVFTYLEFGILASLVSSLALSFYPLVFAESHFNIKDPVEMAFYGLAIIALYYGVVKGKKLLMLLAAVFIGLALGTKFNVIFLPLVIVPWFLAGKYLKNNWKIFLAFPVIILAVFYAFWPALWPDPINNTKLVIDFYFHNGVTQLPEIKTYVFKGFDFFASFWILTTTPIPVIILSLTGLGVSAWKFIKEKKLVYFLVLLWFLVPIARVSLPRTAIYSGVRQIMEFIPAMAILAGIGAKFLFSLPKNKIAKTLILSILIASLGFSVWDVMRIHPNENVYFNEVLGGLPGAYKRNIPYWGYSYGNVYLQGVNWLNENAEPNSKLTLLLGYPVNIPRLKLRTDINLQGEYWSGPLQKGEYAMEMSYNYSQKDYFRYAYYETFLNPVYEVKVDGISILKVWKNDNKYLKEGLSMGKSYKPLKVTAKGNNLEIDLGKDIRLTKLEIRHAALDCQKQKEGYILTSLDGKTWTREPDLIDMPQSQVEVPPEEIGFTDTNFVFFFTARTARYMTIITDTPNSCYLKNPKLQIMGLE